MESGTFAKSISRDMSELTKEQILDTVEHAILIARESPHRANGGCVFEHLGTEDITQENALSAIGKQRVALWESVFFSLVSREQYDSHQPD